VPSDLAGTAAMKARHLPRSFGEEVRET
jgi:hypothetical protein